MDCFGLDVPPSSTKIAIGLLLVGKKFEVGCLGYLLIINPDFP